MTGIAEYFTPKSWYVQ